jgi:hypothetical protein
MNVAPRMASVTFLITKSDLPDNYGRKLAAIDKKTLGKNWNNDSTVRLLRERFLMVFC